MTTGPSSRMRDEQLKTGISDVLIRTPTRANGFFNRVALWREMSG